MLSASTFTICFLPHKVHTDSVHHHSRMQSGGPCTPWYVLSGCRFFLDLMLLPSFGGKIMSLLSTGPFELSNSRMSDSPSSGNSCNPSQRHYDFIPVIIDVGMITNLHRLTVNFDGPQPPSVAAVVQLQKIANLDNSWSNNLKRCGFRSGQAVPQYCYLGPAANRCRVSQGRLQARLKEKGES